MTVALCLLCLMAGWLLRGLFSKTYFVVIGHTYNTTDYSIIRPKEQTLVFEYPVKLTIVREGRPNYETEGTAFRVPSGLLSIHICAKDAQRIVLLPNDEKNAHTCIDLGLVP